MILRRFAVPALLALPGVLAVAAPASAGTGLVPGGSETITVALPAAWAAQADRLGVTAVGLVQAENGCLALERRAGDTACGADEGDLAGQLRAEVTAGTLVRGACRAAGAPVPLDLLDAGAPARLAVSGARCLAIRLSFPDGDDDNVAQSDALSFGVRIVAEGPGEGISGAQRVNRGQGGSVVRTTGTAGGAAVQPDRPGSTAPVVGEQTTPVEVAGGGVSVRTQAADTSLGALMLAWGSLFLGVVVLGLVFFLWWSRRRRRAVA
jgi:hypothetical protein